jgi:citrate synthase
LMNDPEQKIARPRQIYTGSAEREFVPLDKRVPVPIPADYPTR